MEGKLKEYEALLFKWQKSLNLISAKEHNFWQRHIEDSIQLKSLLATGEILIDLGSGAGLPGIPLAIVSNLPTYLIESDRKKSIFLTEAVRNLQLDVVVMNERIEVAKLPNFDNKLCVITARALAPLKELLALIETLLENNNIRGYKLLLLKGARVLQEIEEAQKYWHFEYFLDQSLTDVASWIITVDKFSKK